MISLDYIEANESFSIGQEITISYLGSNNRDEIEIQGEVVRTDQNGFALQYMSPGRSEEKDDVSPRSERVCPVERAGSLDIRIRRWVQNPRRILRPYIEEGMTALDVGCGPGFFSIDMARMVGESGRVIAADLQEGMLQKVRDKIKGTALEGRIILHKCEEDKIGVSEQVDFVLLFYMVHEVQNKEALFDEIGTILNPKGQVLIVEPPFHVSKSAFEETLGKARNVGFTDIEGPKVLFSKTAILKKS